MKRSVLTVNGKTYSPSVMEKLINEYDLLEETLDSVKEITIKKNYKLHKRHHHLPGFRIHGLIGSVLVDEYLNKEHGINHHFYVPGIAITYNYPWTRENLKDGLAFEYKQRELIKKPEKYLIIVKWDVKVSGNGKPLASTFPDNPLILMGPQPEIILYEEQIESQLKQSARIRTGISC